MKTLKQVTRVEYQDGSPLSRARVTFIFDVDDVPQKGDSVQFEVSTELGSGTVRGVVETDPVFDWDGTLSGSMTVIVVPEKRS